MAILAYDKVAIHFNPTYTCISSHNFTPEQVREMHDFVHDPRTTPRYFDIDITRMNRPSVSRYGPIEAGHDVESLTETYGPAITHIQYTDLVLLDFTYYRTDGKVLPLSDLIRILLEGREWTEEKLTSYIASAYLKSTYFNSPNFLEFDTVDHALSLARAFWKHVDSKKGVTAIREIQRPVENLEGCGKAFRSALVAAAFAEQSVLIKLQTIEEF